MSRAQALKYYKIGRGLQQGSRISQYYFDLSINLDPTFSFAYFEKSIPFNKRGDYARGFDLLNRAVVLNPKMHLGYRGWLRLVKLRDFEGAIKDLKKLQEIKIASNSKAWGQNINYLIGLSYLGLNRCDEALKYFEIAINETEHSDLIISLYKAIALYRIKKYDQSIILLKACIDINLSFTEAYYYLGKNYLKINAYKRAKLSLSQALSLYEAGFKIRNSYNEVYLQLYRQDIINKLKKIP